MSTQQFPYDVFISYAHRDDHDQWVEKFVEAIAKEHARFTPTPLQLFFDRMEIKTMHDWEHRILRGLRGSKVMLAMLSPHYFNSAYCRKEWEIYLDHELDRAMTGQGIAPVYIASAPEFEDEAKAALDEWLTNLRRRQFLDVREWRSQGHHMLQEEDVRRRIELLEQNLSERLHLAERINDSPTNIPQHNHNFVGRIEELRRLREALAFDRVGLVAVVQGLRGMGKSALAFEYAHAYAGEYPGGRFLVSVAGVDDLRVPLVNLADQIGVALSDDERKDLTAAFARVRAALEKGPRSLLILDDVDNATLLSPKSRAAWLPKSDAVHIMATTTLDIAPQAGLEIIALDALAQKDALSLLERHREFEDENEEESAKHIVERLGAHTLAVEVVGVYLWQTPDVNYEGYLARLQYEGLEALDGVGRDENIELSRHHESVLSDLLTPTLDRLKPAENIALEFAALLPHEHIAIPWLRALAGQNLPELTATPKPGYPDPWRQIERRLLGLRLLSPGENARIAKMQRLTQDVVASRVEEEEQTKQREALSLYALERGTWIQSNWATRDARWEIEPLLYFALRLLDAEDGENGPLLANRVSDALLSLGRYDEGANVLRRAISLKESLGVDDITLSESRSNLGLVEQTWGHLEEARALLQKALATWDRPEFSAPESQSEFFSREMVLSNLALVEQEDNQLQNARTYLQEVIKSEEARLGTEHPDLATSLSNLATVESELGQWPDARELLLRAIAIEEKTTINHPNLGVRYSNLATVEQALGHLSEAREWLQRALTLFESVLEADHPHLAVICSNLAMIERDLGNLDAARELLNRAITSDEENFAADHPNLATRYSNLGLIEQDSGNLDEAKALLERAIAILKATDETDNTTLASAYSNLAMVERDKGNLAEAQNFMEIAISTDESVFGTEHSSTAISYAKKATIEHLLGNLEAARQLLQHSISIQSQVLEMDHPRMAKCQFWLSQVEYDLGNTEEARRLAELALATQQAKFSDSHPDLLQSTQWLKQHGWLEN
ncbi:hypothetical protein IAD21_06144 [Abditibacteriota bacterium]|nr:hypothetical protein IAD21_06144 [Abditibacteriota bacterium]